MKSLFRGDNDCKFTRYAIEMNADAALEVRLEHLNERFAFHQFWFLFLNGRNALDFAMELKDRFIETDNYEELIQLLKLHLVKFIVEAQFGRF